MCYPNKTIPRVAFTVALALTTAPLLAAATGGGGERDPWIRAAQISVDYFDIKADFEYAIAPFAPAGWGDYVLGQSAHERRALVFDFGETLTRSGDEWGATLTLQFRNGWILDFSARDGRQSAVISGDAFENVTEGEELSYSAAFDFEQISGEVRARYFPDIELWRTLRLFLAAGVGYTEVELTANTRFGALQYGSFTEYKSAQGVVGVGLIWPGEYKNLAFGLRLETYGGIGTQSFKTQSLSPTGGVAVQDFAEDSVYLRVLSDSPPETTLEGVVFLQNLERASERSIAYREFEQTLTRKSRYFFAEGQATLYANYWVDTERMSFYLFGEAGGKVRSHFDGGDATVFTGLFRGMFLKAGIGASF